MADTQREPGVIRADCAYDLSQVRTRLGLGTAAIRTARRKGLVVRRVGRKSFILGRDIIAYLDEHAAIVV